MELRIQALRLGLTLLVSVLEDEDEDESYGGRLRGECPRAPPEPGRRCPGKAAPSAPVRHGLEVQPPRERGVGVGESCGRASLNHWVSTLGGTGGFSDCSTLLWESGKRRGINSSLPGKGDPAPVSAPFRPSDGGRGTGSLLGGVVGGCGSVRGKSPPISQPHFLPGTRGKDRLSRPSPLGPPAVLGGPLPLKLAP